MSDQTTSRPGTATPETTPRTTEDNGLPRPAVVVVAIAAVALVLGAGGWFLLGSSPDAVDITDASAAVEAEGTSAGPIDVDGTWQVDDEVGTFSVADTTGTFVGFRIDEELADIGVTEAVGRTPEVTGTLIVQDEQLVEASFEADLTAIRSDDPRREDAIQEALATGANPTAGFVLDEPVDVAGLADGETVATTASGMLTVNGVTQPVQVPLEAAAVDGVVVVTASFEVVFADHDVAVPQAPIIVSVADRGDVELQLYLTQG